MKMRAFVLWAIAIALSSSIWAQSFGWPPAPGHLTLALWPGVVPGAQANPLTEKDITTAKDALVAGRPVIHLGNVSNPTITLYKPKGNNTGAAVVVFPGGGYWILAIDLEGTEVCNWLNSIGVNCILLKYRVPNSGPYPKSATALEDAQRALRLVRSHAAEWGIDPNRVGVLGFSAGANMAVALSNHFEDQLYKPVDAADDLSCRPDYAVLVYPAELVMAEHGIMLNPVSLPNAKTPPTFIVQAENDPAQVENSVGYFMALKDAGIPAELHIYAQGGHGYGMRQTSQPITRWPMLLKTWLQTIKATTESR